MLLPAGVVGGITTIFEIPTNELAEIVGPWQETQVVMPTWFIFEPEKWAPFGTGVAAMLDPDPTWQTSQDWVVGMWLDGAAVILKPGGPAKGPTVVPGVAWHCVQFVVWLGA